VTETLFDLPWWTVAVLMVVAFAAGWIDAVVGGGGLIQLPALLLALPSDTPVAAISGTNKVSSCAGTISATATYLRRIRVHWADTVPLMVGAAIGSAAGARLVSLLPREWFTPIVLVALIGVGWHTWRHPRLGMESRVRHRGVGMAARMGAIGLGVGCYDGFLGPGTGTFFVIALAGWLGFGFLEAAARAKVANLTTNLAAIVTLVGHVLWTLGLLMAVANIAGGLTGARMAVRRGNGFVRRVLLIVVAGLIVRLSVDVIRGLVG